MLYTTKELRGKHIYGGKNGTRNKGKITRTVFYPDRMRVIGFIIRRPDILLMIKRSDIFVALDALAFRGDRIEAGQEADAWDENAFKRLGVSFDDCFLWEDMPLITESGYELGRVGSMQFDTANGDVDAIEVTEGAAARTLTGDFEIPVDYVRGYHDGNLVVSAEARDIEASGGLAAAAGRGIAIAGKKVSGAAAKAGEAVDKGAYALGGIIGQTTNRLQKAGKSDIDAEDAAEDDTIVDGRQALPEGEKVDDPSIGEAAAYAFGRQIGKTRGMFSSFKEEYDKNSKTDYENEHEDEQVR